MHYTTKGSQGTGIGMYMAQIIIEKKMNGILNVKNRDDGEKGAQIILNLPIHKGKQIYFIACETKSVKFRYFALQAKYD